MKKGLFNNHANDVGRFLKGFHVQINARNEDDLTEKNVVGKLTKATGANYDSGAKIQGEASKGAPATFSEAKTGATKFNAVSANVDKSDYNKKNESAEYWQKQKEQEDEEKKQRQTATQKTTDYSKSAEREKFWAQQKEEPKQQPVKPQPATTSTARSKFENIGKPEPAPAPVRQAPPPKKAAPPPPPEPEPEPEPQYQEEPPAQQEEQYHEEPQYQEEPQQQEEPPVQEEQYHEEPQYQEEPQQQEEEAVPQQEEQYQEETPAESQQGVCQCRALYDYEAQNDGDLSFHESDIIAVLDKSDPNGWWQGELNGVSGYFPSNFVEEI